MARGKEYPDIFVHCAERLGVAPGSALSLMMFCLLSEAQKQAGMIVYRVFEKYSEHNMEEIKKLQTAI